MQATSYTAANETPSNIIFFPVVLTARHRPAPVAVSPMNEDYGTKAESRSDWNEDKATETAAAIAFQAALAKVDVSKIKVVSNARRPDGGRKELAKLARGVFKSLGIKGISVTAPNYSMAQSVDVRLPAIRRDFLFESADSWANQIAGCPAKKANQETRMKVEAILLAAFPATDNRSDSQSDYFDYCWSLSH